MGYRAWGVVGILAAVAIACSTSSNGSGGSGQASGDAGGLGSCDGGTCCAARSGTTEDAGGGGSRTCTCSFDAAMVGSTLDCVSGTFPATGLCNESPSPGSKSSKVICALSPDHKLFLMTLSYSDVLSGEGWTYALDGPLATNPLPEPYHSACAALFAKLDPMGFGFGNPSTLPTCGD